MPNPSLFSSLYMQKSPPYIFMSPAGRKNASYSLTYFLLVTKKYSLKQHYLYKPTDDLFIFQAKKHCVLDLSINITCLSKLC